MVNTVLALPGALISHGCAGGDKVDTAGPSSLQLVIIPITLPVVFSAHHPLDPVPTNADLCQGQVCNPARNNCVDEHFANQRLCLLLGLTQEDVTCGSVLVW